MWMPKRSTEVASINKTKAQQASKTELSFRASSDISGSFSFKGWRGWLFKRSRGPLGTWRRRWFEMRRLQSVFTGSLTGDTDSIQSVALYYYRPSRCSGEGSTRPQKLDVVDAFRDEAMDCSVGAVLSVQVAGRQGRTLLAAESAADASRLLQMLDERLKGDFASSFVGTNRIVEKCLGSLPEAPPPPSPPTLSIGDPAVSAAAAASPSASPCRAAAGSTAPGQAAT